MVTYAVKPSTDERASVAGGAITQLTSRYLRSTVELIKGKWAARHSCALPGRNRAETYECCLQLGRFGLQGLSGSLFFSSFDGQNCLAQFPFGAADLGGQLLLTPTVRFERGAIHGNVAQ